MTWIIFFAVLSTLFAGWRAGRRMRFFLHIFQLEGYKRSAFLQWLFARPLDVLVRRSHQVGLLLLVLAGIGYTVTPFWTTVLLLPLWTVSFVSSKRYRQSREKKPLAYTNRLKRLIGTTGLLALVPVTMGAWWGFHAPGLWGFLPYLGGFFLADLAAPLWVVGASVLLAPLEHYFQVGFKRQARQTLLARPDLKIVAVTGSYGKTSVKFLIAEVLRLRYNVLATPGSYNTPMGICRVVNNQLRPEHQVLVLEMGARFRGDIAELCDLAQPDISVVTSVGVAHLETMGPIEQIALEKSTVISRLNPDGVAVLNADDPRVEAMAQLAPGAVWRVSTGEALAPDLLASEIRYGPDGARFEVRDEAGHEATFQTSLLGRHNVQNILLALAVGRALGLRLRQMTHAVARLQPVAHRLALREENGVTIIDDAFNSNPVGAKNAVEILGQFKSGRRVIVTPGMVELGERQWVENQAFGALIAHHTDLAILVGERQTAPIQDGLKQEGFAGDRLKIVATLFEAQDFLRTYLRPGDVVLYENDLPDQYNES